MQSKNRRAKRAEIFQGDSGKYKEKIGARSAPGMCRVIVQNTKQIPKCNELKDKTEKIRSAFDACSLDIQDYFKNQYALDNFDSLHHPEISTPPPRFISFYS